MNILETMVLLAGIIVSFAGTAALIQAVRHLKSSAHK